MMMRRVLVVLTACAATTVSAQGTLSSQGFGYPPGQFSARAAATGGASGLFDPLSPLNPATLADMQRSFFTAQIAPEYREVQPVGVGGTERSNVQRIPLLAAGLRLRGGKLALGVAASTFLDRSWATVSSGSVLVGTETIATTDRGESKGAITDFRVGAAYALHRTLRLGIAGHALTGDNTVVSERTFADSSRFGGILDSTNVSYRGSAVSLGVEWTPIRGIGVAASMRRGGDLSSFASDTLRSSATVPAREGVALRVDRWGGIALIASLDRTQWSALRGLGTNRLVVRDAIDRAFGAEFDGPRLRGRAVQFRSGYRQRDLPFGITGSSSIVRERALSGGVGLPLAGEFGDFDLSVQRATRRGDGLGTERAWGVHIGFTLRP
jgi:hypothetical protein